VESKSTTQDHHESLRGVKAPRYDRIQESGTRTRSVSKSEESNKTSSEWEPSQGLWAVDPSPSEDGSVMVYYLKPPSESLPTIHGDLEDFIPVHKWRALFESPETKDS
jgi:hypothetical protein